MEVAPAAAEIAVAETETADFAPAAADCELYGDVGCCNYTLPSYRAVEEPDADDDDAA